MFKVTSPSLARIGACALVVAAAMLPERGMAETEQTTADRNRAIVAAAFDRWAAGGSGFFDEVLAADVVWTIEGSGPSAGAYRGREDLIDRAVRPLTSRLKTAIRPSLRRIWADGDDIIVFWDGEAVAGDGEPYRNTYLWVLRMEGDRAAEVTAFLDLVAYDDVLRRVPADAAP